jgi:TolA-binding protein
MNSHLNKEIFSETGCINKDVLMLYKSGKLRNSEKHQVEKHLVDCSLCSDALEGFALIASPTAFNEVNMRLQQLTSTFGTTNYSRYAAIAASVAAAITLTYFVYKQFDEVSVERLAVTETAVSHDTVAQIETSEVPVQQEPAQQKLPPHTNSINEVNNRISQPTAEQPESAPEAGVSASASDEVDIKQNVAAAMSDVAAMPASEEIAVEKANKDVVTFSGNNVPSSAAGYTSNISYVDNRKVIDYSALLEKESAVVKDTKGIPGKYENQKKKSEVEADEQKLGLASHRSVNYLELLTHPISLYNDAKYEAAIKEFDEILVIHPADENARFYKGMSLYYLKKYDQAINLLKPLSNINTQPFSEEALFYVAKSYAAMENKSQATTIFRAIVGKKGFYAERAKVELKKLE